VLAEKDGLSTAQARAIKRAMSLDQSHLATMATRISTSSAMNPSLMLCLMVTPLCFLAAGSLFHLAQVLPALLFVLIGVVPLGIASWQLVRFTIRDPDRLQQERHIENKMLIQHRMGIKEDGQFREVPLALSDTLTGNPQVQDRAGE